MLCAKHPPKKKVCCLNKNDRWRYSFAIIRCPFAYQKRFRGTNHVLSLNRDKGLDLDPVWDKLINPTKTMETRPDHQSSLTSQ